MPCSFTVGLASTNPCSNSYRGKEPFTEQESRAIRDYVTSLPSIPILGLSIHCCLDKWLYPWGFSIDAGIDNEEEIVSDDRELAVKPKKTCDFSSGTDIDVQEGRDGVEQGQQGELHLRSGRGSR